MEPGFRRVVAVWKSGLNRRIKRSAILDVKIMYVINEIEAEMLAVSLNLQSEELSSVCIRIRDRFSISVIMTLGPNGALAFSNTERIKVNALPVHAIDTVGAGDAFVGAFVTAMSQKMALEDCMAWGTVAGGLVCTKPGAQDGIPDKVAIQTRLDQIIFE